MYAIRSYYGKQILEEAFKSDPKLGGIAVEIAYLHHERYDGQGYPIGLHGSDIPLHARVVALVDTFDALANRRVYKDRITSYNVCYTKLLRAVQLCKEMR